MSRKIILIKQELLLLVYELNRSGLLAENEKIRPILAQLEKDRKSGSAGMPRPMSYAVFCLKKKTSTISSTRSPTTTPRSSRQATAWNTPREVFKATRSSSPPCANRV